MAKPNHLTFYRWLLLLPIPVLWCVAGYLGLTDFLENKLLDWRFQSRGEIASPIRVVYVDIDSESITDLGNQPWDRGYYAEVSEALLTAGGVKAIGIDLVFSQKGQTELLDAERFAQGNTELARLLFENSPVVLAASYAAAEDRDITGKRIVRKLPRVGTSAEALPPEVPEFPLGGSVWNPPNVGLIDSIDGGTRRVPLFAPVGVQTFFHMSVELARLYWDLPREGISIHDDFLELKTAQGEVKARVPLQDGQNVEVNWFSRWSSPSENPRASFVDVLVYARQLRSEAEAEREAAAELFAQFAGSIVLIGPVDPLLQDIASTPMDSQPVPRVGIHGNLLKTIVSGEYLRRPAYGWQIVITLALTAATCLLAVGTGRSRVWSRVNAFVLSIVYALVSFGLFQRFHWVVPLAMPLGAAFTTSFAAVAWQLVREERQKGRIKSMFGTYVSPQLVNRMVESGEDPKLGGAEVEITAYFSDIQNFSTFSELLTPKQVVELMNEYLTACTDIVTSEGGTLDKYIGDAVVAMFGAPVAMSDHAYRACRSAVRVQQRLRELRRKWSGEGDRWPELVFGMRTRIGLNSGAAVVGNMGSLTRFNYTMMGDTVNLAARLESGAKTYGATTLVTEATKQACELKGRDCLFRFLDRIVVKGRMQPAAVFELLGLVSEASQEVRDCVGLFEEGMEHYLRQDWHAATVCFQRAAPLEPCATGKPGDLTPSLLYVERCRALMATPPPRDWNGVWVMHEK